MTLYLRITSNYWACSEDEFLFEFGQSSNYYGTDDFVFDHWFADNINNLEYNIKESRKRDYSVQSKKRL